MQFAQTKSVEMSTNVEKYHNPQAPPHDDSLSTLEYSVSTAASLLESANSLDYSMDLEASLSQRPPLNPSSNPSTLSPLVRKGTISGHSSSPQPLPVSPMIRKSMRRRSSCGSYSSPYSSPVGPGGPAGRTIGRRSSCGSYSSPHNSPAPVPLPLGRIPKRRSSLGSYSPMRRRGSCGSFNASPSMRRRSSIGSYSSPSRTSRPQKLSTPKKVLEKPTSILRYGRFYFGPAIDSQSTAPENTDKEKQDRVFSRQSSFSPRNLRNKVTFELADEVSLAHSYTTEDSMQFGEIGEDLDEENNSNIFSYFGSDLFRSNEDCSTMVSGVNETTFRAMPPFAGDVFDDSNRGRFGTLYEEEVPSMFGKRRGNNKNDKQMREDNNEALQSLYDPNKEDDSGDCDLSMSSFLQDIEDPIPRDEYDADATRRIRAIDGICGITGDFQRGIDLTGLEDALDSALLDSSRDASVSSETSSESPKGVQDLDHYCEKLGQADKVMSS